MLNRTSAAFKVFLAHDACDMRKSFNGFHAFSSDQFLTTSACGTCYFDWNSGRGAAFLLEMLDHGQIKKFLITI